MQFVIMKQVAVEAETPEEAVAKINEGKTISITVNQRSQASPLSQTKQSIIGPKPA